MSGLPLLILSASEEPLLDTAMACLGTRAVVGATAHGVIGADQEFVAPVVTDGDRWLAGVPLAIRRVGETLRKKVANVRLRFSDSLLILIPRERLEKLQAGGIVPDLEVLEANSEADERRAATRSASRDSGSSSRAFST